jgi:hypothetical protein
MGVCFSVNENDLPDELPVTISDDCVDEEEIVDVPTTQSLLTNLLLNLQVPEEDNSNNKIYPEHLHPPSANIATL